MRPSPDGFPGTDWRWRSAAYTLRIVMMVIIVPVLFATGMAVNAGQPRPLIAFWLLVGVLALGTLRETWPRWLRAALVFGVFTAILALDVGVEGLQPVTFLTALALVVLASIVGGGRAGYLVLGLAVAAMLGIAYLRAAGWTPPAPWASSGPSIAWRVMFSHLIWTSALVAGADMALGELGRSIHERAQVAEDRRRQIVTRHALGRRLAAQQEVERRRLSEVLRVEIGARVEDVRRALRLAGTGSEAPGAMLGRVFVLIDDLIELVRALSRDLRREPPPVASGQADDGRSVAEAALLGAAWTQAPAAPVTAAASGPGVPREVRQEAFRRFHRVAAVVVAGVLFWAALASGATRAAAPAHVPWLAWAALTLGTLAIPLRWPGPRAWTFLALLLLSGVGYLGVLGPNGMTATLWLASAVAARFAFGRGTAVGVVALTTAGYFLVTLTRLAFAWEPAGLGMADSSGVVLRGVVLFAGFGAGLILVIDTLTRALEAELAEGIALVADLGREVEACDSVTGRLQVAEWAERRRVAHELHDDVGQQLTAIKLTLQVAAKRATVTDLAPHLADADRLLDGVVEKTQALSRHLRPSALDQHGLAAALAELVDREGRRAGLAVSVDPTLVPSRLPADVETACYRIVQEALTNAIRHAGASRLALEVALDGAGMRVVLADDGKGFDVAAATESSARGAHVGLAGMRERALEIGARLQLDSAPEHGTRLTLDLPGDMVR